MKAVSLLAMVVWAIPSALFAQSPEEAYFGDRQLAPDELEAEALDALARNRPTGPTGKPVQIGEKEIQFVFGAGLPTVICAPFRVCDIALEPGEVVRGDPLTGDPRWKATPGISGEPGSGREVWHVYVKPEDVGIQTSLTITTNRRHYHFQLASHRTKYMALVSFTYPERQSDIWARFRELHAHTPRSEDGSPNLPTASTPRRQRPGRLNLSTLSFDYEMDGDDPPWKPVRVYNDGIHTIIEFPKAVSQMQMPALVAVRYEGGVFTSDELEAVNFRVHGNTIKVDGVPNILDLIAGVGSTQTKVRIRRTAGE